MAINTAITTRRAPRTTCEECGTTVTLDVAEDIQNGGECGGCGYYVTRYTAAFREEADWL